MWDFEDYQRLRIECNEAAAKVDALAAKPRKTEAELKEWIEAVSAFDDCNARVSAFLHARSDYQG